MSSVHASGDGKPQVVVVKINQPDPVHASLHVEGWKGQIQVIAEGWKGQIQVVAEGWKGQMEMEP